MRVKNEGKVAEVLAEMRFTMPPEFEIPDGLYKAHLETVHGQFKQIEDNEHREAIAVARTLGEFLQRRAGGQMVDEPEKLSEENVKRMLSIAESWGAYGKGESEKAQLTAKALLEKADQVRESIAEGTVEWLRMKAELQAEFQTARLELNSTLKRCLWKLGLYVALGLLGFALILAFAPKLHAQETGVTIQLQQGGSDLAGVLRRGPLILNCSTNLTCTWSAANRKLTLVATGGGGGPGTPCTTTPSSFQYDGGGVFGCVTTATSDGTINTFQAGANFLFTDTSVTTKKAKFDLSLITAANTRTIKVPDGNVYLCPNGSADGQICTWNNSTSQWIPGDPRVQGMIAHDAAAAAIDPVLNGCYASAAAPTDVSADTDSVRLWCLRSGAVVQQLAHAGTLYDARARTWTLGSGTDSVTTVPPSNASTNVNQWGGTNTTLGQKAMSASVPVVFASDQTPIPGIVSTGNSSTATLGISATFTGTYEDVKNYAMLTLSVIADVASATDGLKFDWSHDGSNTDETEQSDVLANTGRAFALAPRARFFRVRYTNGGTGQATFRLGTVYHPTGAGIITKPLDSGLTTENFAQQVRSALAAKDEAGTGFSNVHGATTTPGAGDVGLVVRNIPSGTQAVSGTVTTTPPANASENVAQFGGTNISTGTGAGGAGIPRVTISNDSSLAANQSVNVAQINGVTPLMGNGATGTGSHRVTIANDNSDIPIKISQATPGTTNGVRPDTSGATASAPPARADFVGYITSGATGGLLAGAAVCDSFVNVTVSTATTTLLVTGVSGRHVRICALSLLTAGANNVALLSGTGSTCGTGTTGMTGGTTAATGYNFAANGGISQGTGIGQINQTNATGDSVCVITSAAVQLSGRISYAIY